MIMMIKLADKDNDKLCCRIRFQNFIVAHLENTFFSFMEFVVLRLWPCPQKLVIIYYLILSQFNPVYILLPFLLSTINFST
jgi:hypothetical protein